MSFLSFLPWWAFLIMAMWLLALFLLCACIAGKAADLRDDYQRSNRLRQEAVKARRLLAQAREVHRLAPSSETRLLVVLGEACRDLVAAVQAGDWDKAHAFKHQADMIEALLAVRQLSAEPTMGQRHRELVRMAAYN